MRSVHNPEGFICIILIEYMVNWSAVLTRNPILDKCIRCSVVEFLGVNQKCAILNSAQLIRTQDYRKHFRLLQQINCATSLMLQFVYMKWILEFLVVVVLVLSLLISCHSIKPTMTVIIRFYAQSDYCNDKTPSCDL